MATLNQKEKPERAGHSDLDDRDNDEVALNDNPTLDDFEALADDDAVAPQDRRRDPLRH